MDGAFFRAVVIEAQDEKGFEYGINVQFRPKLGPGERSARRPPGNVWTRPLSVSITGLQYRSGRT